MSRKTWVRRPPEWRETMGAAAVAAGVGGVVFWLVRLLLARDPVRRGSPSGDAEPAERGEGAAP